MMNSSNLLLNRKALTIRLALFCACSSFHFVFFFFALVVESVFTKRLANTVCGDWLVFALTLNFLQCLFCGLCARRLVKLRRATNDEEALATGDWLGCIYFSGMTLALVQLGAVVFGYALLFLSRAQLWKSMPTVVESFLWLEFGWLHLSLFLLTVHFLLNLCCSSYNEYSLISAPVSASSLRRCTHLCVYGSQPESLFDSNQCTMCLDEFEAHQYVRTLPCAHRFHSECVDAFLTTNSGLCPTCRRPLILSSDNNQQH